MLVFLAPLFTTLAVSKEAGEQLSPQLDSYTFYIYSVNASANGQSSRHNPNLETRKKRELFLDYVSMKMRAASENKMKVSRFLKIQFVAKYQKNRREPFGVILKFSKKGSQSRKIESWGV